MAVRPSRGVVEVVSEGRVRFGQQERDAKNMNLESWLGPVSVTSLSADQGVETAGFKHQGGSSLKLGSPQRLSASEAQPPW